MNLYESLEAREEADMKSTFLNNRNIELSEKAFCDFTNSGDTKIICPKCECKPRYKEARDRNGILNRASISCKCGYITNGEIYL